MPGPSLLLGRETLAFVATESVFGTAAQGYPQAAEAVRVIDANVEIAAPFEMRPDKFGTSTAIGKIDQHRGAKWEISLLALAAGVATQPDITDLLLLGGWQANYPGSALATTVQASSTSTTILVTTTGSLAAGQFVVVQMTAAGGQEVRRVASLVANTSITLAQKLSANPTTGYTIKSCIAYSPKDARADVPDSTTLFLGDNRSLDICRGSAPESFALELGADTAARISVQGRSRRADRLMSTLLNGAVNNSVTSFVVDNGTGAPSDVTTYWQVDSEIVSVTATSGTTWTVARAQLSSSAASHSDNAEIYPYVPTGTYAGSPVPATAGDALFGSVPTAIQIKSARVEFGFGISAVEDEMGDAYKLATYSCQERKVNITLGGACRYDTWGALLTDGIQRTATNLTLQQGDTLGGIVGVYLPAARLQGERVARGGTSEYVEVELSCQAEGTSAGEDECFLFFA